MIANFDITYFTVPLVTSEHIGVLVSLAANAGEACGFTFIISWKIDIFWSIDFTCWDWMVVLYQSMEPNFFAGDGPSLLKVASVW